MAKIGVALLALWAVLTTVTAGWLLVDRRAAPGPAPGRPLADFPSDEIETLRVRVRDLEAELASRDHGALDGAVAAEAPALPEGVGAIMPDEESVRALIAAYRKMVEAGPDAVREWNLEKALERIQIAAEHDGRAHLAILQLIEIATDLDDIEDFVDALRDGGPRDDAADAQVLKVSKRMLLSDPVPARRAAGAEVHLGCVPPGPETFRLVLDAAHAESDVATRGSLLSELAHHGWGLELPPEDRRRFVDLLRRQVRAGDTLQMNCLANWSDQRQDYDLALSLLGTVREAERRLFVLTAFRNGIRLTRGREEEARAELLRVLADPAEDRAVRDYALVLLNSHRPWDADTTEAARRYRDETKGD